tara:strand:- start:352 stop:1296 length:945 start_codon:yes stop_codon:yes gene_type:complete
MDINKILNDISNVFNDNTKTINKKKFNDEFSDGLSYLQNKSKKIKHLEKRIDMPSNNNIEGFDYVGSGHRNVKRLNDMDKGFLRKRQSDYNSGIDTYEQTMTTFQTKYDKILRQTKECEKDCGDILELNKMEACKVGCKLRGPILVKNKDGMEPKINGKKSCNEYVSAIERGACENAYDWKDKNNEMIENDLTSEYSQLQSQNEGLKKTANALFNKTSHLRKQNINLVKKTFNKEASMGTQNIGKMKKFQDIKLKLKPGSNPKQSLTPEQMMLRMMANDSKLRLDSMTMRTYLWFAGMVGIIGGTIYLINKNSD